MDEGRYWEQKCQYGGDGDDDGHDGDGDGDKDKVYEQEYVADQESRGARAGCPGHGGGLANCHHRQHHHHNHPHNHQNHCDHHHQKRLNPP